MVGMVNMEEMVQMDWWMIVGIHRMDGMFGIVRM